ncbi:hypothetical protein Efla_005488 [Eimeria flavescens]
MPAKSAAFRFWDFSLPRASPPSSSSEAVENPPGFECLAEGESKEADFLSSLKEQQQQQQQQQQQDASSSAAAGGGGPPPSRQALALMQRRLWDCAIAPGKAFGMNLLMLYMGGGSGIFGVLILVYALHSCVKTLLAVSQQFKPFANVEGIRFLFFFKGLYVCICLLFAGYLCTRGSSSSLSAVCTPEKLLQSSATAERLAASGCRDPFRASHCIH